MGETEVSSRSLRRSDRFVENQVKDPAKVEHGEDETEEAAERRTSKRGLKVRKCKRSGEQSEKEVVTRDVVDAVSRELGSLNMNHDCNGNSRSSGIVLNAVPQEFVANMERSLARGDDAAGASSSDQGDEDDNMMDLESAEEQEEISTTLSREASALLAELTQVIQKGGDLKKLRVDHLKAYLRHHGLRMSGVKDVLVNRIEEHLKIKDGQGEDVYPRSSFNINCKGDVCLGDTVLFSQTVYDTFDIVKRSASGPALGQRWVAGKVVNESYGAGKQQHTFTIEVLWSTGTKPFYIMRPLQIKGRNLYRLLTLRQPWLDEEDREQVLAEKHARGEEARARRRVTIDTRGRSRSRPSSRAHSKTRNHGNSSRSMPMQSSIQQGFQQNVYPGSSIAASSRTSQFLGGSVQQGRVAPQQQRGCGASHSSLLSSTFHEQGILHVACSNGECDKAGAKFCVTQSCAACCYRNGSTRERCPRHQ